MEMSQLDQVRFTKVLHDAIEVAVGLGYPPNEFRKMLNTDGGLLTVKRIIPNRQPSSGFYRLYQLNRIDLTCEAIIVETPWRKFFDQDLLEIAEKRLRDFGYAFSPYSEPDASTSDGESPAPPSAPEQLPGEFRPVNEDNRERAVRQVVSRPGQGEFRDELFRHYGVRCCVSGCEVADALEAAHITAYRGERSNHVQNGLLLRADLHTLFDRQLFSIEPSTLKVVLSDELRPDTSYGQFDGVTLAFIGSCRPSRLALEVHWSAFQESLLEA